ncbi:unnamed protein product [Ectocarpus fasciculatus]
MVSATATPRSTSTPAEPRLAPRPAPAAPPTATTASRFYHSNEVPRLTKALSVVANLLKSPAKVSSRLFDIGKAIVLLALTHRFSPTSLKVRQLEQSSGADRSRGAVNTISTWARQVCKLRTSKDQAVLELLENAARAAPTTKQTLLERFGMGGTNPASVCKELRILLRALAKELRGEVGRDSPSPSSSAPSGDKGGTATAAATPAAGSATAVAAVATEKDTLHGALPALTASEVAGVNTGVESSLEGVDAGPAIAITSTATADESEGVSSASPVAAVAAGVGVTAGDVVGPVIASASSYNEENIESAVAPPGMVAPDYLDTGTPAAGAKSVSAATADMAASCPGGSSSRKCSALKVGKGEGGWRVGQGGGHLVKEGNVMGTVDVQSSMLVVHGNAEGSLTVRQGSSRQKPVVANSGRPNVQASAKAAARARSRGSAFIARPAGTPFSSGASARGVPRDGQMKAAAADQARRGVLGGDFRKRACKLSRPGHNGAVAASAAVAAAEPAAAAAGTVALAKQDFPRTNKSAELRRTTGILNKVLSDREKLAAALVQQRKLHKEDVERHEDELRKARQDNLELGGQRSRLQVLLLQAYRDIAELKGRKSETDPIKDESSKPTCVPSGCPRPEEGGNNNGGGADDGHHQERSKLILLGSPSPGSPGSCTGSDTCDGSGGDDQRGNDDGHDSDGHNRDEKLSPHLASGSCSGSDTSEGSEEGSTDDDDGQFSAGVSSGCPSLVSDSSYDGSFTYDGNDAGGNLGDGSIGSGATLSVLPPPPPSQQKQQRDAVGLECKGVSRVPSWRAEDCLASARREVLDRFNGAGFLVSLLPLSGTVGGSGGGGGDGAREVATEKGRLLGDGGGGNVFDLKIVDEQLQGHFARTGLGQGLVLKTLNKPAKGHKDMGMREIRVLASFMPACHPNIVNVFATNIETRSIVMEKMGMDLERLLNCAIRELRRVSHDEMVGLCCGAANGLAYMHEMGFAHGDVKPANMLLSQDLRQCKISDFGTAGRLGVDNVGDVTLPYTPPEAVSVVVGEKIPLAASMDVWSMGMVVVRATSRLRFLPTDHEALDQHFDRLFPKDCQPWKSQALEAFLLAHRNLSITYEQRNKHRQEMESAALIWMREVYLGMLAKTADLDDFILSRRVWPDQQAFQHLPEVRKVLGVMLAADPRERMNMRTVGLSLKHPGLWARTTTGLQATASADAPKLAAASTAAAASSSPSYGGGKTSLDVTTLPDCIHRLLSVVDDAADHDMVFTADGQVEPGGGGGAPSWLEVEKAKENGEWWKNVPIPEALVRKGPQSRFAA